MGNNFSTWSRAPAGVMTFSDGYRPFQIFSVSARPNGKHGERPSSHFLMGATGTVRTLAAANRTAWTTVSRAMVDAQKKPHWRWDDMHFVCSARFMIDSYGDAAVMNKNSFFDWSGHRRKQVQLRWIVEESRSPEP